MDIFIDRNGDIYHGVGLNNDRKATTEEIEKYNLRKQQERENIKHQAFLNETDVKILKYLDQVVLEELNNLPKEIIDLRIKRQEARDGIKNI